MVARVLVNSCSGILGGCKGIGIWLLWCSQWLPGYCYVVALSGSRSLPGHSDAVSTVFWVKERVSFM